MTNAMFIIGSGDNLARGRERCVGDLGPGTKAISRPDPNTAATFLSQNDDKKDEMDGRSDGCSGGYGGGGQGGNHQRQKSTVVTNFFPSENFAWVDDAVTWKGGEKDRERGERDLAFGGPSQLAGRQHDDRQTEIMPKRRRRSTPTSTSLRAAGNCPPSRLPSIPCRLLGSCPSTPMFNITWPSN